MSMMLCANCEILVDSDLHPENWVEDEYYCPRCADEFVPEDDD